MSTHVRSPEHSQGSAIEILGSRDHGCGTVCPLNCDSKTFASPSLGGYLRHSCSLRLGALWLLCFNGAGYKHSYLLTYLLIKSCHFCFSYVRLIYFMSLLMMVLFFIVPVISEYSPCFGVHCLVFIRLYNMTNRWNQWSLLFLSTLSMTCCPILAVTFYWFCCRNK